MPWQSSLSPLLLRASLVTWFIGAIAVSCVSAAACSGTYTVQDGDTCDSIGYRTYTSTYQLLALNINNTGSDCGQLESGAVRFMNHLPPPNNRPPLGFRRGHLLAAPTARISSGEAQTKALAEAGTFPGAEARIR